MAALPDRNIELTMVALAYVGERARASPGWAASGTVVLQGESMDEWLVGGALALIGIAYIVWDIRNSLKPRRGSGDSGSGGSDDDSGADGSGGDGD